MSAIIPVIVQQHVEDTGLLWLRRDSAVNYPDFTLETLANLDLQLEANRDGMRIAGEAAWSIAEQELHWEAPGEVFAAAVLALELGNRERMERVLELAASSYELSRAFVSALGWLEWELVRETIVGFLSSTEPALRRLGIAGATVHRQDTGSALAAALQAEDEHLRSRSLRAVGELGREDLLPELKLHLNATEPAVRFSAAWSLALLRSDGDAIDALKTIVEQQAEGYARALPVVARRLPLEAGRMWVSQLAHTSQQQRTAIQIAGAMGDVTCIPWLFEQMETPMLARAAGEALAMITGVDIVDQNLGGSWPEGFETGPTEDPADDDVNMDDDEHSPWPDPEKLTAWWSQHHDRFEVGERYLAGEVISPASLRHILQTGRQPHRLAAAIEIAGISPSGGLFETRAPGFRQKMLLL